MLNEFIYEDHTGKRLVGLDYGVFLNNHELRDYAWNYDSINNRISRFYRSIKERKIPLVVASETEDVAFHVKTMLSDMAEADIAAKKPGKVYVNDCYTLGFITASKKSNFHLSKRLCEIELTLTSDDPSWYRETKTVFPANTEDTISTGSGTDYPYDYAYDYAGIMPGRKIPCDTLSSNEFRLVIYGRAYNPAITIGGHVYAINGTIGAGETLTIDSTAKTIILTTASGQQINWFDKRGRDSYIFEQIPSGNHSVTWNGAFGFDLTVIEKRSEPTWT